MKKFLLLMLTGSLLSASHRACLATPGAKPQLSHDLEPLARLSLSEGARPIFFAPDGKFLLFERYDVLRLWDVERGQEAAFLPPEASVRAGEDPTEATLPRRAWAFSCDGRYLVLAGEAVSTRDSLYDVWWCDLRLHKAQRLNLGRLRGGILKVSDIDAAGDVAFVAVDVSEARTEGGSTLTVNHSASILRPEPALPTKLAKPDPTGAPAFICPTFSCDGLLIAVGTAGSGLVIYNARSGQVRARSIIGHESSVYPLGFTHDGRTLWVIRSSQGLGNPLRVTGVSSSATLRVHPVPLLKDATVLGISPQDVLLAQDQAVQPEPPTAEASRRTTLPFWQTFLLVDAHSGRLLRRERLQARHMEGFDDSWSFVGFVQNGERAAFWSDAQQRLTFLRISTLGQRTRH